MLEHGIEVCCRYFTIVFRAQVHTMRLQYSARYRKGFFRLVIRDRYIVAIAGLIGPVLLTKYSQLFIPICLAE